MGNSQPVLEIIDAGHYGACTDLNSTYVSSIHIAYDSSKGLSTWKIAEGLTSGYIQAGDRVRLPASQAPFQTYLVLDVSNLTVTVDKPLAPFSTEPSNHASLQLEVDVVNEPMAQFTVETVQEGEDSYTYEVFFTGPHLASVPKLIVDMCPTSGFNHYNGMRFGAQTTSIQSGGSAQVQVLTMQSEDVLGTGGYFKLAYNGNQILTPSAHGYPWGVSAGTLQSAVTALNLGPTVLVSRSGYGSNEENKGYSYTITYADFASPVVIPGYAYGAYGGAFGYVPQFSVLTDQQISPPTFFPSNYSEPSVTLSALNDLTVTGSFTGAADTVFIITITSTTRNATLHDTFTWYATTTSTLTPIVAGKQYYLQYGIHISFANARGHRVGDSWKFTAVRCQSPLPLHTSISIATTTSGTPAVGQISVTPGYQSTAFGIVGVYKVPPVFAVAAQPVETWVLSTNNPAKVSQTSLSYRFSYNYTFSGRNNVSTSCLNWNANDYEVEAAISSLVNFCSSPLNCVSVTRSVDNVNNPGGYVYSIYFENPVFNTFFQPNMDYSIIILNETGCQSWQPPSSVLNVKKVVAGTAHIPFTRQLLPLSPSSNTALPAALRGIGVSKVPIYKINGNFWSVTFNSNLGAYFMPTMPT